MILPPRINRYASRTRKCPPRARKVLLAFGGTDTRHITSRALEAMNRIPSGLRVRVNLGPGTQDTARLRRAVKKSPHQVAIARNVPDLLGAMWRADLVVCAGGNMLCELAVMGVPSVAIAAERHEVLNINYWSAVSSTVCGGWERTLDLARLADIVNDTLRNPSRRAQLSRCGKAGIDGNGLRRVLTILANICRKRVV